MTCQKTQIAVQKYQLMTDDRLGLKSFAPFSLGVKFHENQLAAISQTWIWKECSREEEKQALNQLFYSYRSSFIFCPVTNILLLFSKLPCILNRNRKQISHSSFYDTAELASSWYNWSSIYEVNGYPPSFEMTTQRRPAWSHLWVIFRTWLAAVERQGINVTSSS